MLSAVSLLLASSSVQTEQRYTAPARGALLFESLRKVCATGWAPPTARH